MAMCTAGKEIPGQDLTPLKLLVDDNWGELWRAQHKIHGTVLFAAYSTSVGMELFKKSLPTLQRMMEGGGVATNLLLNIKAIFPDEAVPYTLIEDPGGKTFSEFAGDETKVIDFEKFISWGSTILDQMVQVMNMNATPLGLTPDTILYDSELKDTTPWRVAPILPGNAEQGLGLAGGRYSPPELVTSSQPQFVNADTYGLTWILTEAMAKDFELDRDPAAVEEALSGLAPKLTATLMIGLQCAGGMYPDSATMGTQYRRWIRADAKTDLKKARKAQEKQKKQIDAAIKKGQPIPTKAKAGKSKKRSEKLATPAAAARGGATMRHPGVITGVETKGPGAAGLLMSLGKILGFFGVCVFLYFAAIKMVTTPKTTNKPMGTAQLFLDAAVLDRNAEEAAKYTTDPGSARALINAMKSMEDQKVSAKINNYHSFKIDRQAGNKYISEVMVGSETEVSVLAVFLIMDQTPDGKYTVISIDWKGLGARTLGF
ncbi:MAG: hypothetical protein ACFCU1_12030 [Sumerlaeia bacterium]